MTVGPIIKELFAFYRQNRIRRVSKVIALIGIAVLLFVETVGFFISVEANILILTALAFVTLELIETKVYEIEEQVRTDDQFQVYETVSQAYDRLSEFAESESDNTGKLYLISYYGRTDVRNLVATAANNDYEVYMLLKHPSTTDDPTSIKESDIKESVGRFVEDVMPPALYQEHKSLRIRFYRYPVSLNAAKISDGGIGVGWYVIASSDGQPREVEEKQKDDPMFVFTQEARDYETIDQWFQNVFNDLWEGADTVEEVYEQGSSERVVRHVADFDDRKQALGTMSQDPDPEETIIFESE